MLEAGCGAVQCGMGSVCKAQPAISPRSAQPGPALDLLTLLPPIFGISLRVISSATVAHPPRSCIKAPPPAHFFALFLPSSYHYFPFSTPTSHLRPSFFRPSSFQRSLPKLLQHFPFCTHSLHPSISTHTLIHNVFSHRLQPARAVACEHRCW